MSDFIAVLLIEAHSDRNIYGSTGASELCHSLHHQHLNIVLQAESPPHEWERIAVRFEAAAFKLQHLCYGIN